MPENKLSHEDLRKLAVSWLRTQTVSYSTPQFPRGGCCSIIASELVTSANDTPDAIGWDPNGRSILLECKSNRSDFFADQRKPYRKNGCGLGNKRYFFTPSKLIKPEEIPEGWGLLEYDGARTICIVPSPVRELSSSEQSNEKLILMSLIRRINKREFLIIQQEEMDAILAPEEPCDESS